MPERRNTIPPLCVSSAPAANDENSLRGILTGLFALLELSANLPNCRTLIDRESSKENNGKYLWSSIPRMVITNPASELPQVEWVGVSSVKSGPTTGVQLEKHHASGIP
jgi:hypothetical protein